MGALTLSCREIARLVASDEIAARSLMARIMVRVHLMMCRYCGPYARGLKKMTLLAGKSNLAEVRLSTIERDRILEAVLLAAGNAVRQPLA